MFSNDIKLMNFLLAALTVLRGEIITDVNGYSSFAGWMLV